ECQDIANRINHAIDSKLKPAESALNDKIGPLKDKKNKAIDDQAEFFCECAATVESFRSQQQAQVNQHLQEQIDAQTAALQAAGIQVPAGTVAQGSIDDVDGQPPASG